MPTYTPTSLTKAEYLKKAQDLHYNQGVSYQEMKSMPDMGFPLWDGEEFKIENDGSGGTRAKPRAQRRAQRARSNYFRDQAQARTTPDEAERKAANKKIRQINRQSSTVNVGDHRYTNSAVAAGEDYLRSEYGEERVQQMRQRYKDAGVEIGHRKGNIQGLTHDQNLRKEIQERTLRGNNKNKTAYLQHLENKPPVTSPEFEKWDQKRQQFANKINPPRRSTGVPVIDFVLGRSKPTPKPTPKRAPKFTPNAGVNLILTAAGPQTKRNPTNRRPPRTLGTLTRVGNALDSRSSGSDIVDRVNENMHLSNPHLAELGFELF